jgi:hypothetical protein
MMQTTTTTAVHERVGEARTLDRIVAHAQQIDGIWAHEIEAGDWVVVRTRNSVYSLAAIGDGTFQVAGGWFAAEQRDNVRVRVVGCTWGGSAIHTALVAAPGMCVEFDNGVRTTRIREARLIRGTHQRQM